LVHQEISAEAVSAYEDIVHHLELDIHAHEDFAASTKKYLFDPLKVNRVSSHYPFAASAATRTLRLDHQVLY